MNLFLYFQKFIGVTILSLIVAPVALRASETSHKQSNTRAHRDYPSKIKDLLAQLDNSPQLACSILELTEETLDQNLHDLDDLLFDLYAMKIDYATGEEVSQSLGCEDTDPPYQSSQGNGQFRMKISCEFSKNTQTETPSKCPEGWQLTVEDRFNESLGEQTEQKSCEYEGPTFIPEDYMDQKVLTSFDDLCQSAGGGKYFSHVSHGGRSLYCDFRDKTLANQALICPQNWTKKVHERPSQIFDESGFSEFFTTYAVECFDDTFKTSEYLDLSEYTKMSEAEEKFESQKKLFTQLLDELKKRINTNALICKGRNDQDQTFNQYSKALISKYQLKPMTDPNTGFNTTTTPFIEVKTLDIQPSSNARDHHLKGLLLTQSNHYSITAIVSGKSDCSLNDSQVIAYIKESLNNNLVLRGWGTQHLFAKKLNCGEISANITLIPLRSPRHSTLPNDSDEDQGGHSGSHRLDN